MLHNVSHRQILLSVLFIVGSSTLFSQVNIKERVEIKPKPPLLNSTTADVPLFMANTDNNQGADQSGAILVMHPCTITVTATMDVSPDAYGGYPNGDLFLSTLVGGQIAGYVGYPDGSHSSHGGSITFARTCGGVGVKLWNVRNWFAVTKLTRTINSSSASFVFEGILAYHSFTVTVEMMATIDMSYDLATMELTTDDPQMTQCQNTTLHTRLRNYMGTVYNGLTCQGSPPTVTLKVESKNSVDFYFINRWVTQLNLPFGDFDLPLAWFYSGETQSSTATLTLSVGDRSVTKTVDLLIAPTELKMSFGKDIIGFGESTTAKVEVVNPNGTTSPVPPGWTVWFAILAGWDQGFLYSPDSLQVGSDVIGSSPVVNYYAMPQAYPPASMLIPIGVEILKDEAGGVASMKALGRMDTLRSSALSLRSALGEKAKNLKYFGESALHTLATAPAAAEPCNYILVTDTLVVKKKAQLDHFKVTLQPDTIRYSESAIITAIAKNAQNKDIDLDGNTLLTLTIDSTKYGDFINAAGDTIPSPLQDVLYKDTKEGKIKFTANGTNPIGLEPAKVIITAVKADDTGKCGQGNAFVREFVKIKLVIDNTELRPLGDNDNIKADSLCSVPKGQSDTCRRIINFSKVRRTKVRVAVTDPNDTPVKDYSFTIRALVRKNSGRHDHVDNRPTGKFITVNRDTFEMVLNKTGSDGKATHTYLSSGIGGVDSLYLKGTTNTDTATAVIMLEIGDFQELKSGTKYVLTGAYGESGVTSLHNVNHFGTSNLLGKLKLLADTMFSGTDYRLRFNDMSLVYGGPFDIDNNWNTPHQNHREGVSVDVDEEAESATGQRRAITKDKLIECLRKVASNYAVADEGNHFHVTIR